MIKPIVTMLKFGIGQFRELILEVGGRYLSVLFPQNTPRRSGEKEGGQQKKTQGGDRKSRLEGDSLHTREIGSLLF